MPLDFSSLAFFGQATEDSVAKFLPILLRLFVAVPLPIILGSFLANAFRMKDYGWKFSLILFSIFSSAVIVEAGRLNLGVDLKGGVILIYEVDREALQEDSDSMLSPMSVNWGKLVQALTNRINPSGTKEIVVRRYGEWQVEIIVPEVDPIEIERIKKLISTAGALEFRMVANRTDHEYIIAQAEQQADDPTKEKSKYVTEGDKTIGYWARVARETEPGSGGLHAFKVFVASDVIRNAATGEWINVPGTLDFSADFALEKYIAEQGIKEIDVLMATDDGFDVTGSHLGMVSRAVDETMRPCVNFNMKGTGVGLMGGLTGSNLPDKQREFYRRMGILLDGAVLSAPRIMSTISDRGRITGSFTDEEVEFLVGILQAGSLPAALKKVPISENQIGAVLGEDTIQRGKMAIGLSLAAVLVFILVYYRFAGVVACLALALNLLFIVALMIASHAAVTLPGLAGLVLTVGMSVDANVLIFERIREELDRGSALRMAIRNGFSRATTTIVDANLTTFITALVLYGIGTDQIRGFAITLAFGILMSMFTAIFCSRVVFDVCERMNRLKKLTMMRIIGATHVDFVGKTRAAAVVSILLIAVGLVAVVVRGKQIFDIDFLGGTSVTMIVNEATSDRDIRDKLNEEFADLKFDGSSVRYSVNRVDVEGLAEGTVWKIDSSMPDVEELQKILKGTFSLASYSLEIDPLKETRTVVTVTAVEDEVIESAKTPVDDNESKPETKKPADGPANVPSKADKPEPETDKPESKTDNPEPKTDKPEPKTDKPEPKTDNPAPKTDNPAPKTDNPAPKTDNPEPKTDNPEPKTGNPEPKTDKPEPKTDKPEPKADKPDPSDSSRRDLPANNVFAFVGDNVFLLAQADSDEQPKPSDPPAAKDAKEAGDEKPPTEKKAEAAESKEPKPEPPAEKTEPAKPSEPPAKPVNKADEKEAVNESAKPTEAPKKAETPEEPKGELTGPKESKPVTEPKSEAPAVESKTDESGAEVIEVEEKIRERIVTETKLNFGNAINGRTLEDAILTSASNVNVPLTEEDITLSILDESNPDWTIDDAVAYKDWKISVSTTEENTSGILTNLQEHLQATPVWPSASKIGGKVAGDTRTLAVWAMLASLLGIIGYIWIRFQRVVYGLAAVVALVHDVLITLGAIAISYWLAGTFGFLLIEEFKISLPVVAAFLTIIGYSLNDTIVVFDRIREVKGKSPDLSSEMVNTSINQTLSRTLLTSLTTFLVVLILYAIGGQGIHGFAFALVIGVVVGTYSSIFVASPVLLWMMTPKSEKV